MKLFFSNQRVSPFVLRLSCFIVFSLFLVGACSKEPTGFVSHYAPPAPAHQTTQYIHLPGAIHLQTPVSGGKRTVEDYANLARENQLGFLIITDHDNLRYEYGLWPLRGIIKKTVQFPSVLQFGVDKYLQRMRKADQKFKDIIIIDGIESDCFYYWDGSYFKKNLSLINRGRHILVAGLKQAQYYERLPCVGNGYSRFTQYQGDQMYQPYQDLINYVARHDGLSFWAHPEAQKDIIISGIRVETIPYPEAIQATVNYTGFSILSEGYRRVGRPGGIWDYALKEYCQGTRAMPVWAIGELDDYGDKDLDSILTVCLVKEKSYTEVIQALRYGRMYVTTHSALRLNWSCRQGKPLRQEEIALAAISGNELVCKTPAHIQVKITLKKQEPKGPKAITIRLLRNGRLVKEFNGSLPYQAEFKDTYYQPDEKVYYRLDAVTDKMNRLISNPIFIKFE